MMSPLSDGPTISSHPVLSSPVVSGAATFPFIPQAGAIVTKEDIAPILFPARAFVDSCCCSEARFNVQLGHPCAPRYARLPCADFLHWHIGDTGNASSIICLAAVLVNSS